MTARETILAAVRGARPAAVPLPEPWPARGAADRALAPRFRDAAIAAGATVAHVARRDLATAMPPALRALSLVEGASTTIATPTGPHDLADLDLFVCEAVLGVAENGALWLPASRLGERAALFLASHVVVVLRDDTIVPDLHDAYARIAPGAEPFGVFVAGPSKTADIEQALVIGAHGPKALTVLLTAGG